MEKWAKALTDSDVEGIARLYAPDALFVGTGSKAVVTAPEGIRKYFEVELLNNRPRAAVVETGLDAVTGVRNGNPTTANGRVTFVLGKRGLDWLIVHFHRSAMPN